MMKENYNRMQEHIVPDDALVERTLIAAGTGAKRKPILKYTGIAAAAACLVMVGSVPVLASNVPAFYHALYKISPQTAELFKPVEMICENNGIRMEVGAIYFRENTADVYVTMRDLEGDRLNVGEDVTSDFSLVVPKLLKTGTGQASCPSFKHVEYNAEHKTLTMLLEIEILNDELNTGDEVIFWLGNVLSDRIRWENKLDMVDLQSAIPNAEFCENEELQVYSLFENPEWEAYRGKERIMLKPSAETPIPAESVTFTGAGYRDGLLHVQFYFDELDMRNIGNIYFEKADGTRIEPLAGMYGCEDKSKIHDLTSRYTDYLFDISEEELHEYTLHGSFTKYTKGASGDWNVTFTLPGRTE